MLGLLALLVLMGQAIAEESHFFPSPKSSASNSAATLTYANFRPQQQIFEAAVPHRVIVPCFMRERRNSKGLEGMATVLISIEERLRALDMLYSTRFAPRWDLNQEHQQRQLENIEAKISRFESTMEMRLDKMNENINSQVIKEEMSREQMNRKIDAIYERTNHRLGYLENRIELAIAKLQTTIDTALGRLELRHSGSGDCQIAAGSIEDLKKQMLALSYAQNNTQTLLSVTGNEIREDLDRFEDRLNRDLTISTPFDFNSLEQRLVEKIERSGDNVINKMNNMHEEVWRHVKAIEQTTLDLSSTLNATRRECADSVRTLAKNKLYQADRDKPESQYRRSLPATAPSQDTTTDLHRRLGDMNHKLDSNFQMLLLAQNLFLESCHRIQQDEPQLEATLTQILEKILDTLHNRSLTTEQGLLDLQAMLKAHNGHVIRTVSHVTNMVLQASEQSNKDNKLLEHSMQTLSEATADGEQRLQEHFSKLQDLRKELVNYSRIENVLKNFQLVENEELEEILNKTLNDVGRIMNEGVSRIESSLKANQNNIVCTRNKSELDRAITNKPETVQINLKIDSDPLVKGFEGLHAVIQDTKSNSTKNYTVMFEKSEQKNIQQRGDIEVSSNELNEILIEPENKDEKDLEENIDENESNERSEEIPIQGHFDEIDGRSGLESLRERLDEKSIEAGGSRFSEELSNRTLQEIWHNLTTRNFEKLLSLNFTESEHEYNSRKRKYLDKLEEIALELNSQENSQNKKSNSSSEDSLFDPT